MRRTAIFAALFIAALPAAAGTSVLLKDGKVIQATQVRREGEQFVVILKGGAKLSLPAEVVKSVRLDDEDLKTAESKARDAAGKMAHAAKAQGLTVHDGAPKISGPQAEPMIARDDPPRTLSGPEIAPKTVAEQRNVLGDPAAFRGDVSHQQDWRPRSDWRIEAGLVDFAPSTFRPDIVDSRWEPEPGLDLTKDVLAESRSTWSKSIVGPEWTPTDGFPQGPTVPRASSAGTAKLPEPPRVVGLEEPPRGPAEAQAAAAPRPLSAWACGESIFSARVVADTAAEDAPLAPSVTVKPVDDPRFVKLPLPLYEAEGESGGAPRRAIFSIAGGTCRLVGGDMATVSATAVENTRVMASAAQAYNAALADTGGAKAKPADVVKYAFAVTALGDPAASGTGRDKLVLLTSASEVSKASAGKADCELTPEVRKRQARSAVLVVKAPKVEPAAGGDVATFYTWSSAAGLVNRNVVLVARDGKVSITREPVAAHVGAHHDGAP